MNVLDGNATPAAPVSLVAIVLRLAWDRVYALILFLFYILSITFALFVFASQRSWMAFGCALASFIASQGSAGRARASSELRVYQDVKEDYIKRYPDCRYIAVRFSDYFEELDLPKPGTGLLNIILPKLSADGFDRSKFTRLYVVKKRGFRGRKVCVPPQYASYVTLLDISYIFIREEPGDINEKGLFWVLHEMGHAGSLAGGDLNRQFMYKASIFNGLIFLTIFFNWSITYLCMYMLQVIACVTFAREMSYRLAALRFNAEIAADVFALHTMPAQVRSKLGAKLATLRLPDDGGLTQDQNRERKAFFARNLELSSESKSKMTLPGKIYAPGEIFSSVLIAAYLGSTLQPVGGYQLLIAWIYAAIIFGSGLRVWRLRDRTKQEIDRIIAAKSKGR